ncbi:MAG: HEAT repeat domain-containing protein [Promethearchaeota archaeon]
MSYLPNNNTDDNWFDEDFKWTFIELSKVNEDIISKLIDNIVKLNPSEDFYISFESLVKIGKKIVPILKNYLKNNNNLQEYKILLFKFLLEFVESRNTDLPLIFDLYNPDFVIRAKTIYNIKKSELNKYLDYILPLLKDPDDSVRWAVIKILDNNNLIKVQKVSEDLKSQLIKEVNPVIKRKIYEILGNY